jgi:hypothetical protein
MHITERFKVLLIFFFLSFFLLIFHVCACWYSVQEKGDITLLMISPLLYFLPVVGSILYLPFLILMSFSRRTREEAFTGILACIIILSFFLLQRKIGTVIREQAFFQFTQRSEEIILSIEKYYTDKKRYPLTLEHLVPVYLFEVPKTKMGAYPEYHYLVDEEARNSFAGNPYAIVVQTPTGFMSFDRLIYLPKQNYSEALKKHSFTKIGKWVYDTD